MRESYIERKLVEVVKKHGGVCWKWVSPSLAGVPDRIVMMPSGRICFAELKQPDGRLTARQEAVHQTLRGLDFEVFVLWSLDDIAEFERKWLND